MELLELMKLDMTNFTIEQLRPHLQQQSVEYERTKFKEFLETQSSKFVTLFFIHSHTISHLISWNEWNIFSFMEKSMNWK